MKEIIILLLCVVIDYGLAESLDSNATDDKCTCLPKHLLRVYKLRSCKPVMSPECGCPMYYNCPREVISPPLLLSKREKCKLKRLGENACIIDDKVYAIGESIKIGCAFCHCHGMKTARNVSGYMLKGDPSTGHCAHDESDALGSEPAPGCYRIYEPKGCSTTDEICEGHEKAAIKCKYREEKYHYGDQISPKEAPCQTCLCDEKFDENNLKMSTCWKDYCTTGEITDREVFMQHCTPVYFNDSCCHHDFICAKNFNPDATSFETRPTNLTDTCVLRGKAYKIGKKVKINRKAPYRGGTGMSVECTCKVPPLMTCFFA